MFFTEVIALKLLSLLQFLRELIRVVLTVKDSQDHIDQLITCGLPQVLCNLVLRAGETIQHRT